MSTIDEHIAAVFAELRRIGVEPEDVGKPLITTGLTRRSLADWLRQIPTSVGAAELERRLEERARTALASAEHAGRFQEDDASRIDQTPSHGVERWWPTTLMLDAGIVILAEEWDPVGVRLGSVPAEDLGEYAFHLLARLLGLWHHGDALANVSEMIGSIEADLGLFPSPLIHRRYLAARLREIVARYPLPARRSRPQGSSTVVLSPPTYIGPPPLDPEGVCSRCHKFGTVARVTVESDPPRTARFCAACWTDVRSRYVSTEEPKMPETAHERIAWLDQIDEPPMSAESRSWDDTVDFLRLVLTARDDPTRGAAITPALLAELASEIAADAHKMDGPMPDEIDLFLREFAPTR